MHLDPFTVIHDIGFSLKSFFQHDFVMEHLAYYHPSVDFPNWNCIYLSNNIGINEELIDAAGKFYSSKGVRGYIRRFHGSEEVCDSRGVERAHLFFGRSDEDIRSFDKSSSGFEISTDLKKHLDMVFEGFQIDQRVGTLLFAIMQKIIDSRLPCEILNIRQGDEIAGTCFLHEAGQGKYLITNLAIAPQFQGQGILTDFLYLIRKRNPGKIIIADSPDVRIIHALVKAGYRHFGFSDYFPV